MAAARLLGLDGVDLRANLRLHPATHLVNHDLPSTRTRFHRVNHHTASIRVSRATLCLSATGDSSSTLLVSCEQVVSRSARLRFCWTRPSSLASYTGTSHIAHHGVANTSRSTCPRRQYLLRSSFASIRSICLGSSFTATASLLLPLLSHRRRA